MTIIPPQHPWRNGYPTTDGKPMAETDGHRNLMNALIETLQEFFAQESRVYVSGNPLVFYEEGNRRRHVSPDVFVVRGVPKLIRPNYLVWQEGKPPQVVIELTSSTTRREDTETKFRLYQNTLGVREYFLFDPEGDYLDPVLQGYRLRQGAYRPIRAVNDRLPSQVLRLHLERSGTTLRLWEPATQQRLPTPREARRQAEERRDQAEAAQQQAEEQRNQAQAVQRQAEEQRSQAQAGQLQAEAAAQQLRNRLERAEAEAAALRQQLDALHHGPQPGE
jgi:Uma2 family endonuclease